MCTTAVRTFMADGGRTFFFSGASANVGQRRIHPFRAAVPFWGKLETNYLEFESFVPKTGLQFLKGCMG